MATALMRLEMREHLTHSIRGGTARPIALLEAVLALVTSLTKALTILA